MNLWTDLLGFTAGAAIHLGIVVADWVKGTPPELGYADFFKDKKNRALVVKGTLIDTMLMLVWQAGLLPWLLASVGLNFDSTMALPNAPRFIIAALAGYGADSFGKRIARRWEKKADEE